MANYPSTKHMAGTVPDNVENHGYWCQDVASFYHRYGSSEKNHHKNQIRSS